MEKKLLFPIQDEKFLLDLKAGDLVNLSGTIYTARDQAHKRLLESITKGTKLPFDLKGSCIYYCGPTPARDDDLFGSAGPTTSARMDNLTIPLLQAGLKATIGKGGRAESIREACQKHLAVYFISFGGAGAYLAKRIKKQSLLAYPDLGTEAIYQLQVEDFPVKVGFDAFGGTIF